MKEAERVLTLEYLSQESSVYLEWKQDMDSYQDKVNQKKRLEAKLEQVKSQNVEVWEKERKAILDLREQRKEVQRQQQKTVNDLERDMEDERKNGIAIQERLIEKERNLPKDEAREEGLQELLKERAEKRRMQAVTGNGTAEPLRFDVLRSEFLGKMSPLIL